MCNNVAKFSDTVQSTVVKCEEVDNERCMPTDDYMMKAEDILEVPKQGERVKHDITVSPISLPRFIEKAIRADLNDDRFDSEEDFEEENESDGNTVEYGIRGIYKYGGEGIYGRVTMYDLGD